MNEHISTGIIQIYWLPKAAEWFLCNPVTIKIHLCYSYVKANEQETQRKAKCTNFMLKISSEKLTLISAASSEISALCPLRHCRAASHSSPRPIFACNGHLPCTLKYPMLNGCSLFIHALTRNFSNLHGHKILKSFLSINDTITIPS